ncbi:hypothetical protein SDC9_170450 [bioreactor metagenome]|uniref:Uncharacterized protein n=1 Tax=bioreactor metagenome TaxID=1076179 RepID=A0A645G8V0_9ZZZZ
MRQTSHDLFNIVNKTHVQHAIGFIQNKNSQIGKINKALINQVNQTSRCGNQNIGTTCQLLSLRILRNAAKYDGTFKRQLSAVGNKTFVYLQRQLAGWREYQRTHFSLGLGNFDCVQPL